MKTWQSLSIGILIGLLISGAVVLVAVPHAASGIEFISPTQKSSLTISVQGAVNKPGIYTLPVGARVNDGIAAAGGLSSNANLENINLASILEDGEQIFVTSSVNTEPSPNSETQGKININTASQQELEKLPGIGEQKANAIIQFRDSNGNFASIDDLVYVPGFGLAILDTLKDLITVK